MLRTFLALELDETFLGRTVDLIDELRRESLPRVRWVSTSTLHVTVRFLGDTDEGLVPALAELVGSLGGRSPNAIDVQTTSLIAFPKTRHARVLALHLHDAHAVSELAAAAERGVTALGFPPEERAFRPHLTLARFRDAADLRRLLARHAAPLMGGRLTALTLYKSDLGTEAPVHTPLARFALSA